MTPQGTTPASPAARDTTRPQISLVIINRSDPRVADTLVALDQLPAVQQGAAEILVVDASGGDLAILRERFPSVRWIDFEPIPGVVTIPHQRNAGIHHATGEIIVFIDAACIPVEGWLEALSAPIISGAETIVSGASRSPGDRSFRDEATNRVAAERYVAEAATMSLAIHKSVLSAVGDFDERFAYGSDVDFTWRAVDAGFRIRNVPSAAVVHDWGGRNEELGRSWRYGRARARLYLKHRSRWRDLFGRDLPLVAYPAYLLILPLTIKRPWIHLALALPLYRNRGRRPVITLIDHFVRAAAALVELGGQISQGRVSP